MQRVSAVADVNVVNARWWASLLCFSICLHNDECVHVEVDTWRYVSGVSLGPSWHHFFCGPNPLPCLSPSEHLCYIRPNLIFLCQEADRRVKELSVEIIST